MARVYSVTAGTTALVAATAKTAVELATGSTVSADLVQCAVSFDASTAAAGIVVELVRFTSTGTGTAYTPLKYNDAAQMMAAVVTAKVNDTVEPGTPTIVEGYFVPNTAGQFWQLPLGRELAIPPSTFLGIRLTSAAIVNYRVSCLFEE